MDYRDLLKRYIRLVCDREGVSLLQYYPEPGSTLRLSDAELSELAAMVVEGRLDAEREWSFVQNNSAPPA